MTILQSPGTRPVRLLVADYGRTVLSVICGCGIPLDMWTVIHRNRPSIRVMMVPLRSDQSGHLGGQCKMAITAYVQAFGCVSGRFQAAAHSRTGADADWIFRIDSHYSSAAMMRWASAIASCWVADQTVREIPSARSTSQHLISALIVRSVECALLDCESIMSQPVMMSSIIYHGM